MFIGFDYGTSNCAVAVMEQGSPRLLTLSGSHYQTPLLFMKDVIVCLQLYKFNEVSLRSMHSVLDLLKSEPQFISHFFVGEVIKEPHLNNPS